MESITVGASDDEPVPDVVVSLPPSTGDGTTFKIYLPRVFARAEALGGRVEPETAPRGSETILLVEDDEAVRTIAGRVLTAHGYDVLPAATPDEAEEAFARHDGEIALLLTDVVMPGRSGRELCERLRAHRPSLKVLYTSGYADSSIVRHGVLDSDAPFMQKPFTPERLAGKVRDVLDA